jgi:hypothetical protein
MVEIARPRPIISEPKMTVERVPTRSAMRDIRMPPVPEPSHASAPASAGTERDPSTSLAMSLSATAVIHAAPNDIPSIANAADATTQEALVSTESERSGCIAKQIQFGPVVQAAQDSTTHHSAGLLHMLHRNHEASALLMRAGLSRSEGLFFTLEAARLSEAVLQQLNLAMPSPAEKVRPPSADDSPQGVVIARATKTIQPSERKAASTRWISRSRMSGMAPPSRRKTRTIGK